MVPEARDMEPSMLMSIPSTCATTAKGSPQIRKGRIVAVVSKDIGAGSVERRATKHDHPAKYDHVSAVRIVTRQHHAGRKGDIISDQVS